MARPRSGRRRGGDEERGAPAAGPGTGKGAGAGEARRTGKGTSGLRMRDFFGTPRGRCTVRGCTCEDFISVLASLTEAEVQALGGERFMSCQRRSELTLTCVCGHAVHQHTVCSEI